MKLKHSGFTLLELLIVVAIILFIATLSVTFITFTDGVFVRAELEKLSACILRLQAQAQLERKPQKLTIDIPSNSYSFNNQKHKLSKNAIFGLLPTTQGPPAEADKLLSFPVTFKNNTIIFYPDGTISSGTIYIIDKNNKCLYALSCAVSQVSYIRRYKYQNNKWLLLNY